MAIEYWLGTFQRTLTQCPWTGFTGYSCIAESAGGIARQEILHPGVDDFSSVSSKVWELERSQGLSILFHCYHSFHQHY